MNPKTRRILFYFFFLAFLIISALIVAYATGYKLSLNSRHPWQLKKTSALVIKTKPTGARVYLDNELQKSFFGQAITTPASIKDILPDEYNIKLELDGYYPWSKKLSLESGAVTYAENVNFFKNIAPTKLLDFKNSSITFSPNKKYAALVSSNTLVVWDLNSDQIINNFQLTGKNQGLVFSPDSNKILTGNKLISIADNSLTEVATSTKNKKLGAMKFDADNNVDYALTTDKKETEFYQVNGTTPQLAYQLKNTASLMDFSGNNNYKYLLVKSGPNISLNIITSNGQAAQTISLPNSDNYKFINQDNQFINIYDTENNILYLIKPLAYNSLITTIKDIKIARWITGDKLLCANDFEIWIQDIPNGNKNLVTRIGSVIKNVLWYKDDNNIFYTTDHTAAVIELDDRNSRNITEIINLDQITNLEANANFDALYFFGKKGSEEGLYKKEL